MSDYISRADAIDAVRRIPIRDLGTATNMMLIDKTEATAKLMALPSAETHEIRTETHGVCSDLISREDAIKVFIDWGIKEFGFHDLNRNERFIDALSALPSADAVHGEWLGKYYDADDREPSHYVCSECRNVWNKAFIPFTWNYCPSCGARMKAR